MSAATTAYPRTFSSQFSDASSYDAMEGADNLRTRQRRDSAIMDDRAKTSQSNYADTVEKLNTYYQLVKKQIMCHQHLVSGLFPRDTSDPTCNVTHIRDNIYCAAAMWALSQAYKRIDDDQGRTKELLLTAVKTMRGILECWMYQADKVELFKKTQSSKNSLHVLFDSSTQGTVTGDEEYEHLQLDCLALYLIFLVQMTQSGCYIIWCVDEVNFIQNLVFYIERAYRTPDFGVWERGSKYNNGSVELHASSIGTAKAALEAINGMNLYGNQGSNWSVIFIDIDAHYRNRIIFDTILPRESASENTDAALVATISWPVFAIHEEQLVQRTLDKALRKLKGRYGLKRFLRDGYGTVLEEKGKKYKTSDVKQFDGIECEWPMFYCYLAIDSVYKGDMDKAHEYMDLLKPLLIDGMSGPLVPKYYYVPQYNINEERLRPGSQDRLPSAQGNINEATKKDNIFFWGQSVYIIARMLVDGLINISELDPIRRHLPAAERPKANSRYSSFQRGSAEQSSPVDLVIQVSLIAESVRLQQMLATYGIQTQTPHQVEPIQIWPPSELAKAYEQLGVNEKLGLTGRPPRPIGGLGTAKIYRACGYTFVCYSLLFHISDFYLAQDIEFVIDEVKSDLAFLGKCWKLAGRPTFCMILREENLRGAGARYILDLLAQFKKGDCDGTKIRLGRLQEFIATGCIEHLDFLDIDIANTFCPMTEKDKGMQFKSFTDIPKSLKLEIEEDWTDEAEYHSMHIQDLIMLVKSPLNLFRQAQALRELAKRKGLYELLDEQTIDQRLQKLSHTAATAQLWSVVRYCSSVLGKLVDSLAPSITAILVRGKQLTISVYGQQEHVVDKPITPLEIKEVLYTKLYPVDPSQAVLQQELIINIGTFITTTPELFQGILKIRIGLLVEAMKLDMKYKEKTKDSLYTLSPSAIKKLLFRVLDKRHDSTSYYTHERSIIWNRQLDGCLNRVPRDFFERVWHILERTPSGIKLSGYILPQQPTLSDMTQYELNFSLVVDQMLSKIVEPTYRQLIVETIVIVDTMLTRNPELSFQKPIELDLIFKDALFMFTRDHRDQNVRDSKDLTSEDLALFFDTPPNSAHGTTVYIVRAVMNMLLDGDVRGPVDSQCSIS